MKKITLTLAAVLTIWMAGAQTLPWAPTGGPDAYGYTWRTSDDTNGPTFTWVDIISNGLGTEVTDLGDDNSQGFFNIGFDFQYYWVKHNQVCIGSNGYIHLGGSVCATISSGVDGVSGFPPTPTGPTGNGPGEPNDILAPFMADLSFASGANATTPNPGRVFYYSDVANKQFIVTFDQVPFWVPVATSPNEYEGVNTFQVILDGNDSTITFQYQIVAGDWAATYNNTTYPFVTGIENSTGGIGLMAPAQPVTTASKPVNNSAITFYPPANALINITDIGIRAVNNPTNSARFVPYPQTGIVNNYPLRALIANEGNVEVTADILVRATVTDTTRTGQPGTFLFTFDTIKGGLDVGEVAEVSFTQPFSPPRSGPLNFNVGLVNVNTIGDLNSTNDAKVAELVAVDTTGTEVLFDYSRDDFTPIFGSEFPTNFSFVNWTNNNDDSGLGIFVEPFSYPVNIEAIEMSLVDLNLVLQNPNCTPAEGVIVNIREAVPGSNLPGDILYTEKVPLTDITVAQAGQWSRIVMDSVITIDSLGFFVSFIQDDDCVVLVTETGSMGPFSNRTYEILGGTWANYRNASNNDAFLRAVVNLDNAVFTNVEPQLANLQRFEIFPNPNEGRFKVELELNKPSNVDLRIMDSYGRKVYAQALNQVSRFAQDLDLGELAAGVYFVQIMTNEGAEVRRVVIK